MLLLGWGWTWLGVAVACVALGRFAGARLAGEGAVVSFGLALFTGLGAAALHGAHAVVERRLRAAGTAWSPPGC